VHATASPSHSRQILLDTETTGLSFAQGHRIIEIGCVELIDRRFTGKIFHTYLNADKEIDAGAFKVHGISNDTLKGEPVFSDVANAFIDFIKGAEVIIHNAPFDVGFLDNELTLLPGKSIKLADVCHVTDSLDMARKKHPGARASLDALVKRYNIDAGDRTLHGAIIDCEILGQVYLAMTGGQKTLSLKSEATAKPQSSPAKRQRASPKHYRELKVIAANDDEILAHNTICSAIGSSFTV